MQTRRFSIHTVIPVLIIALLLFYSPLLGAEAQTNLQAPPTDIPFSKNLLEALAATKESGKPLVIAFSAVWCPYCRVMKETTLKNPKVLKLAQEFEWVAIDIDRNVSLVNTYEITAVPQFQIFDVAGNVRGKIIGQFGPSEFYKRLSDLLDQIKASAFPDPEPTPVLIEGGERTEIVSAKDYYRAKAICFSKVGYGPLDLPSQSPIQALRLGLSPRTPSTLGRGQVEARFRSTWVNIWATEDPDFVFDYEALQTNVGLAYGISDTFQLELGFETRSRFGGEMDSFIQEFHDLFNIDQNGRDEVPRGDFTFDIGPSDGDPGFSLTNKDKGIYATNLLFSLQHNVTCGTMTLPAIAYAVTVRKELKSEDLEGGTSLDFGAWLSASQRYDTFYIYGTLGYTRFGRDHFRTAELRDDQFSALLALEWRFKPRASLIAQYLLSEGVAESLGDLSSPSHEITLGAKWEVVKGTVLEFGLIENVITLGNSPDFGIHFGVTSRF